MRLYLPRLRLWFPQLDAVRKCLACALRYLENAHVCIASGTSLCCGCPAGVHSSQGARGAAGTGLSLLLGPPRVLESITQGWGTDYHSLSFINVFYTLNTTQYSKYLSSSIITFSSRISALLEASQSPWKNMTENILLFPYCILGSVGDIRWRKTVLKSYRYIGRKDSLFAN